MLFNVNSHHVYLRDNYYNKCHHVLFTFWDMKIKMMCIHNFVRLFANDQEDYFLVNMLICLKAVIIK